MDTISPLVMGEEDRKPAAIVETSEGSSTPASSSESPCLQITNDGSAAIAAMDEERDERGGDGADPPIPQARFKVLEKVFARDEDGVLYSGYVRRVLYGRVSPRTVKIGYISLPEADELIKEEHYLHDEWHYYVSYDGWNTKWDRWINEANVFCFKNEVAKEYVARLHAEHKALRQAMMKSSSSKSGRKAYQTIDPTCFMQNWRKAVDRLDAEYQMPNPQLDLVRNVTRTVVPTSLADLQKNKQSTDAQEEVANHGETVAKDAAKRKAKRSKQFNISLEQEQQLRAQGLTKRRPREQQAELSIVLPSTLKKVLVDQWEIVCHCGMVATLPALVTVREALNQYLESKGIPITKPNQEPAEPTERKEAPSDVVDDSTKSSEKDDNDKETKAQGETNNMQTESAAVDQVVDDEKEEASASLTTESGKRKEREVDDSVDEATNRDAKACKVEEKNGDKNGVAPHLSSVDPDGDETMQNTANDINQEKDLCGENKDSDNDESRHQEWIEMADGVAMFFDDAIENLLYREEQAQFRMVQSAEEFKNKNFSDLYGTEFLLRLFSRLPGLLSASDMPSNESKKIVAKVNDLVRFLHKNQSNLFGLRHSRPSPAMIDSTVSKTKTT